MRKCNQGKSKVQDLSRKENVTGAAKQLKNYHRGGHQEFHFS